MLEFYPFIIIEILISSIITLVLLLYYARKHTNIIVFITAYISWFLNFVFVIFLPYDIYYIKNKENIPNITKKIIENGYSITYWTLFIFSWIFIPLMQSYEDSGEIGKKEKLKSSLKENIIFYGAVSVVGIIIFILSLIKYGLDNTFKIAKDCSLIIGILYFFFLLSYSLITYPKTLYHKLNDKKQIKYHEWRSNQFYEKLGEIQFDLITRFIRLKVTIKNLKDGEDENEINKIEEESINTSNASNKKKQIIKKNSLSSQSNLSNKPREVKDHLEYMEKKYNDFDNISKVKYGIDLKKERIDDNNIKPIIEIKDLIELNRKINKKLNDNLRMQCRIRNCYRRWAILNTILYFNSQNEIKNEKIEEKKSENDKNLKDDKTDEILSTSPINSINLKEEGFIPLENFSKFKIFYYTKIKKIFIYIIFTLIIISGIITVLAEILMMFKIQFFKFLNGIKNIFVLHIAILIPIIYFICMSNYTLFKIKLSSYIYMYGHRQTDSVSLMIFSSYLSRIYFAICLNILQTLNQFKHEESNNTQSIFEEFFGIEQTEDEDNLIIKLCRLSPCFLILFMILFLFNIPRKIGNLVGYNLFEFESEERDLGISDGHKYLMNLNKKLKGKKLDRNDEIIFQDR